MPHATSLAIAGTAVLVPLKFVADLVDLAAAVAAGEVETWTAPTLAGEEAFATLTPLGAERCRVAIGEALDVPEPASVPTWHEAGSEPGPIRRPVSTREKRDARVRIDATPEPWRAILDLAAARRELDPADRPEPRPAMPARKKSTKPRRSRRKTRVGSTRVVKHAAPGRLALRATRPARMPGGGPSQHGEAETTAMRPMRAMGDPALAGGRLGPMGALLRVRHR